jgi:hypothetical protein
MKLDGVEDLKISEPIPFGDHSEPWSIVEPQHGRHWLPVL